MRAGDSGTGWEPSHLHRLLRGLGVGDRFSYRELARQSGHRLSRTTWSRMDQPIPAGQRGHRWDIEVLQVAAETLRKMGCSVTVGQLERAVLADLGYTQAVSGDDLAGVLDKVQSLSHTDRVRLIQEVAFLLAPDGPAERSEISRAPADRADPSRG